MKKHQNNSPVTIGHRLKRLRSLAMMSRETVAHQLQVSHCSVKSWEHGYHGGVNPQIISKLLAIYKTQNVISDLHWVLYGKGKILIQNKEQEI